jgi:hypothetical protein
MWIVETGMSFAEAILGPRAPSVEMDTLPPFHVSVWAAPAAVEDVARIEREIDAILDVCPRVGLLLVIEDGVSVSPEPSRRRAIEMLRRRAAHVAGVAICVGSEGFLGSAVRSMFVGLGLLLRPRYPWRLFAEPRRALEWLCKQAGADVAFAQKLDARVTDLRARLR